MTGLGSIGAMLSGAGGRYPRALRGRTALWWRRHCARRISAARIAWQISPAGSASRNRALTLPLTPVSRGDPARCRWSRRRWPRPAPVRAWRRPRGRCQGERFPAALAGSGGLSARRVRRLVALAGWQDHQRLPGERVGHGADPAGAPVLRPVLQEVVGPDVVRSRRPEADAGAVVQPGPAFLPLRRDPAPRAAARRCRAEQWRDRARRARR